MDSLSGAGFSAGVAALRDAGAHGSLCAPFLAALTVTGAAISTLGEAWGSETVCASDPVAARLDEIQLDLGEGPCWEALRTGVPVFEPDVQAATSDRWPVALMGMQEAQLGAVFAFPMRVGLLAVGVVDLYDQRAGPLPAAAVRGAAAMVHVAARLVLHRALLRAEVGSPEYERGGGLYSRREVHQASGMLAAQTGATVSDALLLLRAYAYAAGRTVRDLSADVIARRVDFTDDNDPGGYEETK
ncbi:GAF and ANTAR domain-containing protein [Curtobacterium sp. MCPF17_002]|uniref:GAF and ANTAR domain-containing protein n=1 Tax=Curtobacterium sp. MCPF17_002 TaxID=2175645 RepID=UPI0021AD17CD|nr:GAF and ANTAR domain-containing protein [Curtobacterium sp. MCPF17_002]WIB77970.1 GAF and ANTAR domain-containing protein [Curtobacterium sp. MCPF17_002]